MIWISSCVVLRDSHVVWSGNCVTCGDCDMEQYFMMCWCVVHLLALWHTLFAMWSAVVDV